MRPPNVSMTATFSTRNAAADALSLVVLAIAALAQLPPSAGVSLQPSLLFGDNMVLQLGRPGAIFGTASPGEIVTLQSAPISVANISESAIADKNGRWLIRISAPPLSLLPGLLFSLTLAGSGSPKTEALTAVNVTYGDVFLCSGQSNVRIPTTHRPSCLYRIHLARNATPAGFQLPRLQLHCSLIPFPISADGAQPCAHLQCHRHYRRGQPS